MIQNMQAIEISEYGAADVLRLVKRSVPEITQGEVLIKVRAAGLNRPDIVQRLGKYPPPPGVTDIPGLEVAGQIVESRHADWIKGQKICALLPGGGYAEYAIAHGGQCLPIPDNLTMTEAAALPETIFTVWNNLFKRGGLQAGQRALIHGGSSGIGTMAIMAGKALGATIIVTAGSDKKCQDCLRIGADQAINYKTHDFTEILGKDTIDVVLDMVGGDYVPRNLQVLKTDGRHVSIAFLNGAKTEINLMTLMQKRIILTGSTLRPRSIEEKQQLRNDIFTNLWPHVQSGTIKPVIFKTFPLAQAADAHRALEEGDHVGKIVLIVND
ncbi:MAG: NAD(P)H-quinone oxidoreductase [Alphaproteobacteria bacterium CG_4_9_14_3_um_filter_47_13]|nr:MAG: NAD(P)H-quinone oxidoreductase [Alphaproteobacteria bacterium CG_4_9_14_3_um_filter_47_13]